jgi:hypothetical protein
MDAAQKDRAGLTPDAEIVESREIAGQQVPHDRLGSQIV